MARIALVVSETVSCSGIGRDMIIPAAAATAASNTAIVIIALMAVLGMIGIPIRLGWRRCCSGVNVAFDIIKALDDGFG